MDVKNIVVAPYSVGLLFSTVFSLTPASSEGKKRGKGLEKGLE